MSAVLQPILTGWKSPRRGDPDHVLAYYIEKPDRISCLVACEGSRVLGFQSLKLAGPDSEFDVPQGWGVIGTYVANGTERGGIGRRLFDGTRDMAVQAGLARIDATIGSDNQTALAYYEAMGFRSYRTLQGAIGKLYRLDAPTPDPNP